MSCCCPFRSSRSWATRRGSRRWDSSIGGSSCGRRRSRSCISCPCPRRMPFPFSLSFPLQLSVALLYPPPVAAVIVFVASIDQEELRGEHPSAHGRVPARAGRPVRARARNDLPQPDRSPRSLVRGRRRGHPDGAHRLRDQHDGDRGMADAPIPPSSGSRAPRDARRGDGGVPAVLSRPRVVQHAGRDDDPQHRPVGDRRLHRAARLRVADAAPDAFPRARDRGARPQAGGERVPGVARPSHRPSQPAVVPAEPREGDHGRRGDRAARSA